MKYTTIYVRARREPRGNRSGYTANDYAAAAAKEINLRMMEEGMTTHPSMDNMAVNSAVRRAEREIEACDDMFRDLLYVEREEHEEPEEPNED